MRGTLWGRLWATLLFTSILVVGLVVLGYGASGLPGLSAVRSYPAPPPGGGSAASYAFARTQTVPAGAPVTYNPCRSIDVVVNDDWAPDGTQGIVTEALQRVHDVTGLTFTYRGYTSVRPDSDEWRSQTQFGLGYPPVLIAWSSEDETPRLDGDVVGVGGSSAVTNPGTGHEHYVTGSVALDSEALGDMLGRRHGRELVRAVVLHELGHVVGLTHVDDPTQLMYHDNVGATDFGAGDLAGLRALGKGPCED